MSGGIYGGDEVGALVFDPGHHSFRMGFAGEDSPKFEVPSFFGTVADPSEDAKPHPEIKTEDDLKSGTPPPNNADTNKSATRSSGRKFIIDYNSLHLPRKQTEIGTFMKDGMIDDWEAFETILDYAYKCYFMSDSSHHPVLFSEAPWNTKVKREKVTEIVFEKYNVPAFYLCKNAVLSAFSNGRSTGLVVDSGASYTSAVPIYDGYCLTQAIVKTPLAGDVLTAQCRYLLDTLNIEPVPAYFVAHKEPVNDRETAVWTNKTNLPEMTASFKNYLVKDLIEDFQSSVLQIMDTPYDDENAEKIQTIHYEFPNGYHQDFGSERQKIAECLFDTSYLKVPMNVSPVLNIGQVVHTSVNMCDIDIRAALYGGIVVTGGNSLIQGFVERLNREVSAKCPGNVKVKIQSAPTSSERRFGAWIGGSILASLGSFQQMWISKQEYDESGKGVVLKKCP